MTGETGQSSGDVDNYGVEVKTKYADMTPGSEG